MKGNDMKIEKLSFRWHINKLIKCKDFTSCNGFRT